MTDKQKIDAKQRIFDAALSLFALKGFAAVGTREIAKAAQVNISMLNYYFGGKVAILKAMINECYDKYYNAIQVIGDETISPEERVRIAIRNVIDFHRNNRELAMVAFNTTPVDIPEILEFKLKWVAAKHGGAVELFRRLGLDTTDVVTRSVVRGMLSTLIGDHFQFRYVWEHILKSPEQSKFAQEHNMKEPMLKFDDAYYEQYAEILATLYFHGLHGIAKMQHKKKDAKGGKNA